MDEKDDREAASARSGDWLTPAVRRLDADESSGPDSPGESRRLDDELTPAVRRVREGDSSNPAADAGSDGEPTATSDAAGRGPDDTATDGDAVPPEGDADGLDVEELIGPQRPLDPRIRLVWVLQSAVTATIVGGLASVALSFVGVGEPWVGGVVFAALFVLGVVFALLRYRVWRYQVREDSLYLRRGVVTRVTTIAPYVRIQHVDVRRSAIERTVGLATTVVYTAGSRGADVSIPGLTPERAADLQERLKRLAIAAEGEDAV